MLFVTDSIQLHREYLTKEAIEGFGDFKIWRRQVIRTVKYADDIVLRAKEDAVLQVMVETEIGRCCGMEMSVEKTEVMIILSQSSPIQTMIDVKQPENVEY
jgi:hypothetical protein